MSDPKANVNVTALLAGVTTLLGTLGAITATGLIGRLLRNEPQATAAAFMLLLLGGLMYVFGGLPVTRGRSERMANVLASCLTVTGIGVALVTSVDTYNKHEAPQMDVTVGEVGKAVTGTIEVGNLSSDHSVTVLVNGLKGGKGTKTPWHKSPLARYEVGPNSDGSATVKLNVPIAAKTYDAVAIEASAGGAAACVYNRQGLQSTSTVHAPMPGLGEVDGGCVLLPLPAEAARPKPRRTARG